MLRLQIRHQQIHVPANKDGMINITSRLVTEVLRIVLNRDNYPLLVHCNRGKHRTGCVMACVRKVQLHTTESAVCEYRHYASPKSRIEDEDFIRGYDPSNVSHIAHRYSWIDLRPLKSIESPYCAQASPVPSRQSTAVAEAQHSSILS